MLEAQIFVSETHNPFVNLALENALLSFINKPSLFLYQNSTCVVIGRAQNPWIEADITFLQQRQIPLLRRQSGGGAVVHDLGNLNFSFISPRQDFDKTRSISLVQQALFSLGLNVEIGERQDLLLAGKKVSGSAFRETKDNCFHHGTLLIASDLSLLKRSLQAPIRKIVSKSIPSRRSQVINLNQALATLTIDQVKTALIHTFAAQQQLNLMTHPPQTIRPSQPQFAVEATLALYQSEDWIYNRTLPFTEEIGIDNQTFSLTIESGQIIAITPFHPKFEKFLAQPYQFYHNRDAEVA